MNIFVQKIPVLSIFALQATSRKAKNAFPKMASPILGYLPRCLCHCAVKNKYIFYYMSLALAISSFRTLIPFIRNLKCWILQTFMFDNWSVNFSDKNWKVSKIWNNHPVVSDLKLLIIFVFVLLKKRTFYETFKICRYW